MSHNMFKVIMIEQLNFPAFELDKEEIKFNTSLALIFRDFPNLKSYIESNIDELRLKDKIKVTIDNKIFDIFKLSYKNENYIYIVNIIQIHKSIDFTNSFDSIYDFALDFIGNLFEPEHLSLFEKQDHKLILRGFRGKDIFKEKNVILTIDKFPNIKKSYQNKVQTAINGKELTHVIKDTYKDYSFTSIPIYKMNYSYGIFIMAGKMDFSQIKDKIYLVVTFLNTLFYEHEMSNILKILRILQKRLFEESYLLDSEGRMLFPLDGTYPLFDTIKTGLPKFKNLTDIVDRKNPYIKPVGKKYFYIISKITTKNNSFYFIGKQKIGDSLFNYNIDTNYQTILTNFFSDAPFGLFLQEEEHIIYYNKQFLNMFPAFLSNKDTDFFSLISKEGREKIQRFKEQLFKEGVLNSRIDITRNNTIYVYNMFLNTFKNQSGVDIIGIVVDITNIAVYEKEIIELKKRETLQNLSSIIGNQINNLLQPIVGYASYLKMIAGDNTEIKEIVSKIEQSTIMATDLIHRVPLKIKQPGEVIDLFEESKNILEIVELIKPESIKIYYSGEKKKYCSLISSTGFNQILLNIIYNALEAIREEGVIEVSFDSIHIADKEKIRIYGLKNQDFVHIKIRDTGVGIEEASMREIFKPFYTTKQGGHSGLGLSMVLEIVENNNGFIEILSKRFRGTDVNVYLPQYSCEEKQLMPDTGEHGKKRVDSMLIIEDNEIVSSFIDSILNSLHINHYITKNPHEGILYMQKNRNAISHVYLDFNIKGISIIDLFNKLFSANGNAKFIISSGYFEREKLHTLLELNNDIMILKKPFDYSAFIKAIQYN